MSLLLLLRTNDGEAPPFRPDPVARPARAASSARGSVSAATARIGRPASSPRPE
jgi:hypothetical protein